MPEHIDFDIAYRYSLFSVGITVPVIISLGEKTAEFDAKVDTGSTYSVFQRLHGEFLGLEIESGLPIKIGTPTGSFAAYGHQVLVSVLDFQVISTVYFAESEYFDRNILGRIGWLDRVKLGLIDSEGLLYLSPYE